MPLRALDAGVRSAAVVTAAGVEFATLPVRTTPAARVIEAITEAASEVLGGKPARRRWRGGNRCWIEVRGLAEREPDDDVGSAVLAALRAHRGVISAALNYPLSRVIVEVEETTTVDELCDVVTAAENLHPDSGHPPVDLPADGTVLAGSMVLAAMNTVGLGVALAGRVVGLRRLPAGLNAVVALVDYQPRLRRAVEQRLGAGAADTAIGLATAAAYTVTQLPAALGVDLFIHLAKAAETRAAATIWERREPGLAPHARCVDRVRPAHRPKPLPAGPIERQGDRSGLAQAAAAPAIGILTGDLDAAATAVTVAAPKAARTSRESFAATLARGLADRHGVLPVRPRVFRRLDRVDAVVVDPRALCCDELRVARIRDVPERERAAVWEWAQDQMDCGVLQSGWQPVPRLVSGNGSGSAVLVRYAHHPLASAVLGEVRRSGAQVVSVDVDTLDDLRSSFDDLDPVRGSLDEALARTVHRLQQDGRTVAVVSSSAPQALADADVAIGIAAGGPPPWHADLLVDDLDSVWRIVHALPAARRASERGVEIATGASLLGALLMIPGVRDRGLAPVTAGAAAGAWTGYRLARGALGASPPPAASGHEWHAMSVEQVGHVLPPPQPARACKRSWLVSAARPAHSVIDPVRRAVWDFAGAMRDELSDPLIPVLAVGSAASAVLGSPVDAILVGSVLAGNAALAATQRIRSERLLRRLLAAQDPPARKLVGADRYAMVHAADLRPGDVIEVRPGEVVPADARLIRVLDVEVDESSLTGESLPVSKQVGATPAAPVAERACLLFATTTVVAGTAVAIVTGVGEQTQAHRATATTHPDGSAAGLQTQLKDLTNKSWPFSLVGGGLVTALGLLRRTGLRQAVSSGVAVSVAAVPEGLPLVATLAQQASARRLTRAGALVRTPRSVEALGRVDVVCFDKTGTLSENRLRVTRVHAATGLSDDDVLVHAVRATPHANGESHEHATDRAVAEAGRHLDRGESAAHLPFRSGRPFSASVCGEQLSIKGAPEVVLAACADADEEVQRQVRKMAAEGLRVIAVATRQLSPSQAQSVRDDADDFAESCGDGLRFAGLLGLSDTPRAAAAEVLAELADRGIGVRLITGDHPVTATAIAAAVGLPVDDDQVISGPEWEALSRREQEQAVQSRSVFARMSPEHKVQIVETIQRLGHVCAMVGDGSNDAAAIRTATVGIGVAARGSDPARVAADVMLLDGRIRSLLDALDEGRQLWRRVQAAVAVLLGGNAGEVAFAIAGTVLTGRAPLNTRQLLLVNVLTDALPAAALAVSPPSARLRYTGRGPDRAALWRTVAVRGTTTASAAMVAWVLGRLTGRRRRASTVALVALVATQLGQTLIDSHSPLVVGTAAGSLVVLGALISTPGVSQLLGSTPLGPVGWCQALSTAAVATAVAAIAPRLFAAGGRQQDDQSTISMTPRRHSTAYTSRNGTVNTCVSAPVNASESAPTPVVITTDTVRTSGVELSNTS
ncbi:cation-translocating P-type ATPase [Nocardia amamiensis]|uniref:Cation-translocating P-type ATPase n=1 Tax=Nocardia amamiensis TaxID=404578 RepID=A0ABS0CUU8_9NOCA|nr:cation-translocating P-type ATPase [Nocardia amamiensis]MBF6300300.1 cation-translocating P-type ATPase [Nocardia amamiensis]